MVSEWTETACACGMENEPTVIGEPFATPGFVTVITIRPRGNQGMDEPDQRPVRCRKKQQEVEKEPTRGTRRYTLETIRVLGTAGGAVFFGSSILRLMAESSTPSAVGATLALLWLVRGSATTRIRVATRADHSRSGEF
jgi:hypothetical protein